jgi:hypothetical protein
MMIKANAGKMRGIRVMRDPEGILLDPFTDETGIQYGYVVVYGEEAPAIFDGTEWHPVLDGTSSWEDQLQELITTQATRLVEKGATNQVYAEIARMLNLYAMAPTGAPTSNEPQGVTYFGG